jgi:hypothetical protein
VKMITSRRLTGDGTTNRCASSKGWGGLLGISVAFLAGAILVPFTYSGPPPPGVSFDTRGMDAMTGLLIGSAAAYFMGFWRGLLAKGRSKRLFLLSMLPVLGLVVLILLPPRNPMSAE